MSTVHGYQGPYPVFSPQDMQAGNFGRNTAYNLEALMRQNPERAKQSTIQYGVSGPSLPDAFGYCEQQIGTFDQDRSGDLNKQEFDQMNGLDPSLAQVLYRNAARQMQGYLTPVMNSQLWQQAVQTVQGLQVKANNFFNVLDRDKNGRLDVPEAASYLLFQDDAMTQVSKAVPAFEAQGLMPPGTSHQVNEVLNMVRQQNGPHPERADGKITPSEQMADMYAIEALPTVSGIILDEMSSVMDLRTQYQQFKQRRR